jgi:hypothetical protein
MPQGHSHETTELKLLFLREGEGRRVKGEGRGDIGQMQTQLHNVNRSRIDS